MRKKLCIDNLQFANTVLFKCSAILKTKGTFEGHTVFFSISEESVTYRVWANDLGQPLRER